MIDLETLYHNTKKGLRTNQGRNFLTFIIFLAISTVFWLLLALNDDIQKDYQIPVQLEDFPENITLLSGYEPSLSVTIKDKGSSLMRFEWGNRPNLKLKYDDFIRQYDSILIYRSSPLNSSVRGIFGSAASIVTIRPDSLRLIYTTNPGIKMAITVNSDIHTQPQYAYAGHPIISVDSVTVYSNSPDRYKTHTISTRPIVLAELTDTVSVDAQLDAAPGARVIPSTVRITFPVEPLVAKKQSVPIEVVNIPFGQKIVTFPSITEVSYLIPKSMYNAQNVAVRATVDYNDISRNDKTLYISLSRLPAYYKNPSLSPEQVEYVIEHIE